MVTNKTYEVGVGLMATEVEVLDVLFVSNEIFNVYYRLLKRIYLKLPILIIKKMIIDRLIIVGRK